MKKLILLTLLMFQFIIGHDGNHPFLIPYISPGIQIGYDNTMGLILSPQLTIGTGFSPEHFEDTMPIFIGKTFGMRTYHKKNSPLVIYKFSDNQISTWIGGVGMGKLIDKNGKSFKRTKIWIGAFGLIEYEKIYFDKEIQKQYSALAVFPLPLTPE